MVHHYADPPVFLMQPVAADTPRPPWEDLPACPKDTCAGPVIARVVPEDDEAEVDEVYPSDELAALNDCDGGQQTWCWCMNCKAVVDVGAAGRRKAVKAEKWWNRDDREQAWAEELRRREVDRVAAEHAARQTSMFEGSGS